MIDLIRDISRRTPSKIIMVVVDGLGGLPHPATGKTELETANTPNLDMLAQRGMCGLSEPIAPGITPGSAPGHLALFGYDPVKCNIGRGVLEAIGIGFELQPDDVAARGNFATVDEQGIVTDRRAGRIPTEKNAGICRLLDGWEIDGVRVFVQPVREHRFVAVFRGKGLSPEVSESDPQAAGELPRTIEPFIPGARRMADIANRFVARAKGVLVEQRPANMVLLRGFSQHPDLSSMSDIYKLKPAAIAAYPMYRGLAKLAGMEILQTGSSINEEFTTLDESYPDYDFIFIHIKGADAAGEDGDFERKVKVIEEVDRAMSRLIKREPDVIIVTGDHSTPAALKAHSWHPVPLLLYSKWCRPVKTTKFGESACAAGALGRIQATSIMPLAMAHALKLEKFGA